MAAEETVRDAPAEPRGGLHEPLADVLAGLQRLIRRRLRVGRTRPPLGAAQADLLRLVTARPGIRVSDAARELLLAGNSVSSLVNRLTRDGYLIRETDPADRRSALLRPTPAAESRLRERDSRR